MLRNELDNAASRLGAATGRSMAIVLATILAVSAAAFSIGGATALAAGLAAFAAGYLIGRAGTSSHPSRPMDDVDREGARAQAIRQTMHDLVGGLDAPAFVLDPNGIILWQNQGARDLFAGLATGLPLHRVSRNPNLFEALQRAKELGMRQTCDIVGHASTGSRLFASVTPLPNLKAASGQFMMLVQFRDLSDQHRVTQLRTDFVANASHELRTPLASIKGFIETLQGPASSDAAARDKFLSIMETQAGRMSRILDDLLSLSRVEMREHLPPSDTVDLLRVLQTTVEGLEPIAREAKIELKLISMESGAMVRAERDELVQVFQNLIQNAIKYGHEAGKVDVALVRHDSGLGQPAEFLITVSDDGPGIAEEHLPRLTERFYRVDTRSSRARGGTGLGLAIVKHILNRHRGQLLMTSTPGKGSTFTVVLNAIPSHSETAKPATD